MDSSPFSLDGRNVLVTGGNSGIGLGIAEAMLRAGARVAIHGRSEEKNRAALERLQPLCEDTTTFVQDLAETEALPAFYERVSNVLGGVDVLVNNAGMIHHCAAEDLALEDWRRIEAVNVTAPFVLAQCYARERKTRGGGSLLFTASLMSEVARPSNAPYTITKGGVRQMIKALAVEWAPHGIRVNGLGPGYIETPLTRKLVEKPEFDAWIRRRTPLGRWGRPADLAGAAVFLASDASAFVTGQILYVDGGILATV